MENAFPTSKALHVKMLAIDVVGDDHFSLRFTWAEVAEEDLRQIRSSEVKLDFLEVSDVLLQN